MPKAFFPFIFVVNPHPLTRWARDMNIRLLPSRVWVSLPWATSLTYSILSIQYSVSNAFENDQTITMALCVCPFLDKESDIHLDPSRFRFRRLGRQIGMPKVAEKIIWIICIWQGCVGSIQWMLLPWWVPGVHWHLGHGRRSFLRGREACSRAHGFFVHDGKGGQLPLIQGLDPKTAGQKAKDYAETVNIAYVLPFPPSYRGPQYICRLGPSVDFMDQ